MPEHLFRFRTIHALLDSRHELEHQEIYFSPPEQLNDPLEGFKDIFWQGDAIVWTNLLRHISWLTFFAGGAADAR
jgi:hypothetical protein